MNAELKRIENRVDFMGISWHQARVHPGIAALKADLTELAEVSGSIRWNR
jgi:hypothetical protein